MTKARCLMLRVFCLNIASFIRVHKIDYSINPLNTMRRLSSEMSQSSRCWIGQPLGSLQIGQRTSRHVASSSNSGGQATDARRPSMVTPESGLSPTWVPPGTWVGVVMSQSSGASCPGRRIVTSPSGKSVAKHSAPGISLP